MKQGAVILGLIVASIFSSALASAEVLTDRCSGSVAFPPAYDDTLASPGTIVLTRGPGAIFGGRFHVTPNSSGFIRWYCNSTTGNIFDPGTWQFKSVNVGVTCQLDGSFQPMGCVAGAKFQAGAPAFTGWTAEESRCSSHTGDISAGLGSDRLLQITCNDGTGQVSQDLSVDPMTTGPASVCYDTVQGHVPWDYNGDLTWNPTNVNNLCGNNSGSQEPAWCFLYTMQGGVNWGGGTQWQWQNASNLCKGTTDAVSTINCFNYFMSLGYGWQTSIGACQTV